MLSLRPRRSAFTLVELLVCLAIIAMLIAIVAPAMGRARTLARRFACAAQLRSITTATFAHASQARAMPLHDGYGPVQALEIDARAWVCPADRVRPAIAKGSSYIYTALREALPSADFTKLDSIPTGLAYRTLENNPASQVYKELEHQQRHKHMARFDGVVESW